MQFQVGHWTIFMDLSSGSPEMVAKGVCGKCAHMTKNFQLSTQGAPFRDVLLEHDEKKHKDKLVRQLYACAELDALIQEVTWPQS